MDEQQRLEATFAKFIEWNKSNRTISTEATEPANASNTPPDNAEIKRILGKIERRVEAKNYINDEVRKYEERLYILAKFVAEEDGEAHIITKSHAERARLMINTKKRGLDWSDGWLTLGSLLAGLGIPVLFELFDGPITKSKSWVLIFGIIGAIIATIGVVMKAKK